jgi:hypothetical protein
MPDLTAIGEVLARRLCQNLTPTRRVPWHCPRASTSEGNEVTQPESPSGVSPATPQGRLIEGARNLGSQPGWRGRAGRTVAYVTLVVATLAVVAVIAGVIWLSGQNS